MRNWIIRTITVDEAYHTLKDLGMRTTPERIRAGIKQGVYPWGRCIVMEKEMYEIYAKQFYAWVDGLKDPCEV